MAINFALIPNFTDAQMLQLFRYGVAQLAISEEVTLAGRTVRRAQLPELIAAMNLFESRVAVANNGGSLTALATLNDPDIGINQHPGEM
jgi:sulfur carrier protein ThiS